MSNCPVYVYCVVKIVHSTLNEAVSSQVICKPVPTLRTALNDFFTSHLLTAEEFSEVAGKGRWEWEDHLAQVLLTKPTEVMQIACQVLEKHGCSVKRKLKSE